MAITSDDLHALREHLLALRAHACDLERRGEDEIGAVDPSCAPAARNLVAYLALRQHELSWLQRGLHEHGLSSLGVVQGHVLASIEAVLEVLDRLCEERRASIDTSRHPSIDDVRRQLDALADETLGPCPPDGSIRIMVTMPTEAAEDAALVDTLLAQGMSVMRVNCAHDGPERWLSMVRHLRAAEARQGRRCLVSFDLAGPKLRTGPIEEGPEVVRFKPTRDVLGRVIAPARIACAPAAAADDRHVVPLSEDVCRAARPGDELYLRDARGRNRTLVVESVDRGTLTCTSDHTVSSWPALPSLQEAPTIGLAHEGPSGDDVWAHGKHEPVSVVRRWTGGRDAVASRPGARGVMGAKRASPAA